MAHAINKDTGRPFQQRAWPNDPLPPSSWRVFLLWLVSRGGSASASAQWYLGGKAMDGLCMLSSNIRLLSQLALFLSSSVFYTSFPAFVQHRKRKKRKESKRDTQSITQLVHTIARPSVFSAVCALNTATCVSVFCVRALALCTMA
ncbi:MAG: hypothetical protein BYD32DRAFT_417793 [Podila humilis]|nr:MAG: hypothetical protein BYD32DRAFT_417793 [Podila humilis]